MAAWLDLIGSLIFGSLLALNVMRVNAQMAEHVYQGTQALIVQGHAVTVAEIMEDDFQHMGIGVSGVVIVQADTSQIEFLADLEIDGQVDTLHYAISGPEAGNDTLHPNDRVLYRTLNNATQELRMGITEFELRYYDSGGQPMSLPVNVNAIRQVEVLVTVESTSAFDSTYARSLLQVRVQPKNLALE